MHKKGLKKYITYITLSAPILCFCICVAVSPGPLFCISHAPLHFYRGFHHYFSDFYLQLSLLFDFHWISLLFGLPSGFPSVSSNSLWISVCLSAAHQLSLLFDFHSGFKQFTVDIDFHTRHRLPQRSAQNTTHPQNQNQPSQPLVPKVNRCFFTEKAGLGSSADDYISELVVGCINAADCNYL